MPNPYVTGLLFFLLALPISADWAGSQSPPQRSDSESHTVSGLLEQLDLQTKKGKLKTALGKVVFFEIVKPELFKEISVGQQVTIQLDDRGRAIKAIESHSIPELPAPAH